VSLTGALLVVAILLPQFIAQLRISFLHGGFAQLARDDVIVAAVGDIGRNRVGPASAAGAAADPSASALLAATALTLAITLLSAVSARTLPLTSALSLSLSTLSLSLAAAVSLFSIACAIRAALASSIRSRSFAIRTAGAAASATLLPGDDGLLIADASVENAQRRIQFTIDLRGTFARSHRSAAAAAGCTALA